VADASPGTTIGFALSPSCSAITLTSGVIDITTNVTIDGPGASALAVSGDNNGSVFDVGPATTVAISGVSIMDGTSSTNGGGIVNNGVLSLNDCSVSGNTATNGGGILNDDALSLSNCTLSGNSATNGGGILNEDSLTLSDSTLSGNTAANGGGVFNHGGSFLLSNSTVSTNDATNGGGIASFSANTTLADSTLSGNTATNGGGLYDGISMALVNASTLSGNGAVNGGGMFINSTDEKVTTATLSGNTAVNGGGIFGNGAALIVTASTLSGNSASGAGGQDGGGFDVGFSGASLAATIVADSTSGGDCSGKIVDLGYNSGDDATCGFAAGNHSRSGVNPELGPLQNNGGPTETQAPASDSPVVNQIPVGAKVKKPKAILCPGTDQRGLARPQGTACDIGAVEVVSGPDAITSADSAVATSGSPFSFTVTTIGSPTPSIATKGRLKGLKIANNGDGTATISGIPKKKGVHKVTITATFGTGPSAPVVTQAFTLTVDSPSSRVALLG
jgi:hypothetical protein